MEHLDDETPPFDEKFVKVNASETIVKKENLNLGDGSTQSIENSTSSDMECFENETPRFDKKFVKVDASETIVNKDNLNIGDGRAQSIENSTSSDMECLEDETPRFDEKFLKVDASKTSRVQSGSRKFLSGLHAFWLILAFFGGFRAFSYDLLSFRGF